MVKCWSERSLFCRKNEQKGENIGKKVEKEEEKGKKEEKKQILEKKRAGPGAWIAMSQTFYQLSQSVLGRSFRIKDLCQTDWCSESASFHLDYVISLGVLCWNDYVSCKCVTREKWKNCVVERVCMEKVWGGCVWSRSKSNTNAYEHE
jgi:hypothetical protein